MRIFDYIELSIRNLKRASKRTVLTILSISLGAMLFITIFSYVLSLENLLKEQYENDFNVRTIDVYGFKDISKKSFKQSKEPLEKRLYKDINLDALDNIKKINNIEYVALDFEYEKVKIQYKQKTIDGKISAFDTRKDDISNFELEHLKNPKSLNLYSRVKIGRFLENKDYYSIVVGEEFLKKAGVKNYNEVLNEKVKLTIENVENKKLKPIEVWVQIVGVANTEVMKDSLNYIPYDLMKYIGEQQEKLSIFENRIFKHLTVVVDKSSNVKEAIKEIENLGYGTASLNELNDMLKENLQKVNVVVFCFVLFLMMISSMIVNNTMLSSLYQRMRFIGVLKVLGATKRKIVNMFLIEGLFIGVFGWILGFIISLISINILDNITISCIKEFLTTKIDIKIHLSVIIISFISTVGICLLCSIYSSKKASNIIINDVLNIE